MSRGHAFQYMTFRNGEHGGRCTCGFAPIADRNKQVIEEAVFAHQQNVQRALAGLKRTASSPGVMKSERDWYLLQSENRMQTPEQRELWKKMADELSGRLNDQDGHDAGQLSFDELL